MKKNKPKYSRCPTCGNRHSITKDGFEWLDCMRYFKERSKKNNL